MPTIFLCNMMEVTLFLACIRDTVGCFQDLAGIILAPNKIKNIKHCKLLGRPGTGELRSAICGVWGTDCPVTLRIRAKMPFQKPWILGHSHQICHTVPNIWTNRKHKGDTEGYILANQVPSNFSLSRRHPRYPYMISGNNWAILLCPVSSTKSVSQSTIQGSLGGEPSSSP